MAVFISEYYIFSFAFVVATLRNVQAVQFSEESMAKMAKMAETKLPMLTECSREHGINVDHFKNVFKNQNFESIDKCFGACIMKREGWINESGMADAEKMLASMEKSLSVEDFKMVEDIVRSCIMSANDAMVGDDDKACERAGVLTQCMSDHMIKV